MNFSHNNKYTKGRVKSIVYLIYRQTLFHVNKNPNDNLKIVRNNAFVLINDESATIIITGVWINYVKKNN